MENVSLTIEKRKSSYRSEFVSDKLGTHVLNATAIVVVNVYESRNLFQIKITSSGFTRENYSIEIEDNIMRIYGRKMPNRDGLNNLRGTFGVNTFSKSFCLPNHIDKKSIKIQCYEGVLIINIPKL